MSASNCSKPTCHRFRRILTGLAVLAGITFSCTSTHTLDQFTRSEIGFDAVLSSDAKLWLFLKHGNPFENPWNCGGAPTTEN